MAIHEILICPDPRLRKIAQPVANINAEILQHVADMYETMEASQGAGLAATQINVQHRIVVIDDTHVRAGRFCMINPEILEKRGEQVAEEGCLSVPGHYDQVSRAAWVKVRFLDEQGQEHIVETENERAASVFQHEIDHLDGKLYIDYLSRLKQVRVLKKLEKYKRLNM